MFIKPAKPSPITISATPRFTWQRNALSLQTRMPRWEKACSPIQCGGTFPNERHSQRVGAPPRTRSTISQCTKGQPSHHALCLQSFQGASSPGFHTLSFSWGGAERTQRTHQSKVETEPPMPKPGHPPSRMPPTWVREHALTSQSLQSSAPPLAPWADSLAWYPDGSPSYYDSRGARQPALPCTEEVRERQGWNILCAEGANFPHRSPLWHFVFLVLKAQKPRAHRRASPLIKTLILLQFLVELPTRRILQNQVHTGLVMEVVVEAEDIGVTEGKQRYLNTLQG